MTVSRSWGVLAGYDVQVLGEPAGDNKLLVKMSRS